MLINVYASLYQRTMLTSNQPVTTTIPWSVIDAWIVRKLLVTSFLDKIFVTGKQALMHWVHEFSVHVGTRQFGNQ